MIRFLWIIILSVSLYGGSLSLYDLAFLVSKSSGKSVIFSNKVDQKIKIVFSSAPVDYLPLFRQALKSNGYVLKSEKSFYYVDVPKSDPQKSEGLLGSFSSLKPPPSLVSTSSSSSDSIKVVSNGQSLYNGPIMNLKKSDSNSSNLDENISFHSLTLSYLNPDDINNTLAFSGFKYSFSNNFRSVLFAVPQSKLLSFNNFVDSLKSLDIPRKQVTLKITVFDSNNNKLRDLGLSPLFNLDANASSYSGAIFSGSYVKTFYDKLHLLDSKGVVSTTDTPTFLLSDNQLLDFKSVVNVPFLDENVNVTSQTSTNQSQKYTYKPIGFKVLVRPTIVNDLIYLDFSISFENVISTGLRPTTSEKSIKNRFSLHSGDLVVLAGISKQSVNDLTQSVPYLSDIPYLGNLFTRVNNSHDDTSFNISIEVLK